MNKFQPFSFQSVEAFLDHLPPNELKIVERLRHLVFDCIPDAKEKLVYNVPFYYRHARICYIWPASVPWGTTVKQGVDFAFCKGHLLADAGYLETGNRKEVFIKRVTHVRDLDANTLRQLLYEAVIIDEETKRQKKYVKSKRQL